MVKSGQRILYAFYHLLILLVDQPGELEGGKKRATDPIRSFAVGQMGAPAFLVTIGGGFYVSAFSALRTSGSLSTHSLLRLWDFLALLHVDSQRVFQLKSC